MTTAFEYQQEKSFYQQHNLCFRCHQDEPQEGHMHCATCIAKWKAYHQKHKIERNRKSWAKKCELKKRSSEES